MPNLTHSTFSQALALANRKGWCIERNARDYMVYPRGKREERTYHATAEEALRALKDAR